MRTNHYCEWRGRGISIIHGPGHYILLAGVMLVSGGGGGGGDYSVRALSKYLGRDTTYTMTMWAGLVRCLSGS